MKVSLVDVDGHNFPNLALMKLSAWHKAQGDTVDWYSPLFSHPDRIYASKVFTFTPDYEDYAPNDPEPERGGTGYDLTVRLPDEIESMKPDYSIYPQYLEAYGFTTRGCIRNCPWCVVPRKEGSIRVVASLEEIAGDRKNVVLMDNNFLAAPEDHVRDTLEYSAKHKIRIDFNQALDAQLVTEKNATWLAKAKWIKYIRFACDTSAMLPHLRNAVTLVRAAGYKGDIFVYVLAKELEESHERILRITDIDKRIFPFCQPFRNFETNTEPDLELKHLARWCNVQSTRKTTTFKEYYYHANH